jgi:streptogramin lyase
VARFNGIAGAFLDDFVAPGSGGLTGPGAFIFGPDGRLYVTNTSSGQVKRYDGATGTFLGNFAVTGGHPNDVKFGPDGNLYVTEPSVNAVKRYDGVTGAFLSDFVAPESGGLNGAYFLTFGPSPMAVGGSVTGLTLQSVLRKNKTSGQG